MTRKTCTHANAHLQKPTLPEHAACDILQRRHSLRRGRKSSWSEYQNSPVPGSPTPIPGRIERRQSLRIQVRLSYCDYLLSQDAPRATDVQRNRMSPLPVRWHRRKNHPIGTTSGLFLNSARSRLMRLGLVPGTQPRPAHKNSCFFSPFKPR